MSRVRADQYTNNAGTGSPLFTHGVRVTGVATATTFDGNLTGNADTATYAPTAGIATNAQGLTGTPNLNVGVVTATTFSGSGASLTNLPSSQLTGALPAIDGSALTGIQSGVWTQIDSQQISSSTAQVDVIFGANAGITTAYAQIKVYYDVWLNSADKLYVRGAHGFSGTFANDVKTTNYYYSGFWHRAGEAAMNFPTQGENASGGLISANNNKEHHNGEMIISNAAGRLYTTGNVNWPALVYNTQGYTGGDTDAHNFTISGHLKGGDNSPLQGIRILTGGQNIIAGEVRTYGLTA